MSHFLCKLTPPRPTFLSDMSADEALVMRRHREYWTPRVEIGVVIAMGPVADPAGAYGVAIIEAPSRTALDAMLAADPAILSGTRIFATKSIPCPRSRCGRACRLLPINSVTP